MSTPPGHTIRINPHRTFNNKQSHHDLYEILTYNIPEFHKYLKKNINSQINNPYINIKQKAYIYDGETQTNSDKGEYIIEFIYYNRQKNSLFPKNIFKDVHFTLHRYSSISNKLHFRFEEFKNKFKYTLDLEYEDNQIYIKEHQNLNKIHKSDITTCKMIIQAINNYISDTISEKEEKCRQIRNNMHGRKRGRYNSNPNRLFGEEEEEEGEVREVREGGTKQKKNKIKLNTIKKQDLIKICKKNKLKGYSKLNKEQLIKFVKKNI
tara:strand:+ start:3906 stop:4700 length:795 start_codon:yes stop_codon:yes gene_type:complete